VERLLRWIESERWIYPVVSPDLSGEKSPGCAPGNQIADEDGKDSLTNEGKMPAKARETAG